MLKKLRIKFIVVNMLIVTCMLLVVFGLVFANTQGRLDSQSRASLQSLMQGQLYSVKEPYFVLQATPQGGVAVIGSSYYDLQDEAFLQELISQVARQEESTGVLKEYDLRYGITQSIFGMNIVFLDISGQSRAMSVLVQSCLLIGLLALSAFFGISVLLARWAIRPVEKAWEQQKQFVSDASHELKTPLTVIMSNAELLQSPELSPEEKAQFSENLLTMSRQMRNLVEGMLELSRADDGQIQNNFERVDLSQAVQSALLPFEPVLFEKGLTVSSHIEPEIFVKGSSSHLCQVIEIFLDNAGKYSHKGLVAVQLQRQGKNCILSVANPGTPIPEEDWENIFQRFYRADPARSRTGSFGLGLSIARSIVEAHGGRIWVQSNETGNCFFVQLPCN